MEKSENKRFTVVPVDLAHKDHLLLAIIRKAVIPVKTGIQKLLKSQVLWALAFAGVTI